MNRQLKADYVNLDMKNYEKSVNPTEDELKSYYQSNKSQFDHPERAKARHILIALRSGATPDEEAAVVKTLSGYRQQILSGKTTFEKLAAQYSQDPGSKNQGGARLGHPRNHGERIRGPNFREIKERRDIRTL